MFAHLCTIFKLSIEMYDRFNFKLPDFQFALLSSDAFDPGAVVIYPEEIELLNARSNPKRKKEFLGVRHLRNQLKITSPILYHSSGRPYFSTNELALSISHTKDFIALANAGFPIGIDIEQKDRDAARIINKFAREDEKVLCTDNPKEWYLQLWCAKEAIYKLVGIENLSFKNEIRVHTRQKEEGTTFLSAIVQQGTQNHHIDVQIRETSDLQMAVALFKAAP
jgi:4'-phosphopantetheinyl transferase EntD